MLKDSDPPRYAARRTKRTYSADTKAELLAACNAPGASIAAVASAHGMNANVLHRWLKESSRPKLPIGNVAGTGATTVDEVGQRLPSFIALPLLTKPAEPVEREINLSQLRNVCVQLGLSPAQVLHAADQYEQQLRQQGVEVVAEKPINPAAIAIGLGLLAALFLSGK